RRERRKSRREGAPDARMAEADRLAWRRTGPAGRPCSPADGAPPDARHQAPNGPARSRRSLSRSGDPYRLSPVKGQVDLLLPGIIAQSRKEGGASAVRAPARER